eukprot:gnl/Hemi2/21306_TR7070_c0_g1_i1.p1 gnl/Hemi2/21306_TR7070_c0_g1~~gnl/Hemi2/21306_TR7070_c0_g1_i1.p1  ORF type:complete len:482 (+),score=101.28 gnl/Hemi2/21306_TR7070_c0_g1_i1:79-1524(+)
MGARHSQGSTTATATTTTAAGSTTTELARQPQQPPPPPPTTAQPAQPQADRSPASSRVIYVWCMAHGFSAGVARPCCTRCRSELVCHLAPDVGVNPEPFEIDLVKRTCFCWACQERGEASWVYKCKFEKTPGGTLCNIDECVMLREVRNSQPTDECFCCKTTFPVAGEAPVVVFSCGHVVCAPDCFAGMCQYAKSEHGAEAVVLNPTNGYASLKCASPCTGFVSTPQTFKLAGKDVYEFMKRWGAKQKLLNDGAVECANRDCGAVFIIEEGAGPPPDRPCVACPSCSTDLCVEHRMRWELCAHTPRVKNPLADATREVEQTLSRAACVNCPTCQQSVELAPAASAADESCTHMCCNRCNVHFCYFCGRSQTALCLSPDDQIRVPNLSQHNVGFEASKHRCPRYLTDHPLLKTLSPDLARAEFLKLRTIRMLHELSTRLVPSLLSLVVARDTSLLSDFGARHETLLLRDILEYVDDKPYRMP